MTRHKRGKYALAIEDFERACADDPDNLALRKLLKQACDKFEEVLARVLVFWPSSDGEARSSPQPTAEPANPRTHTRAADAIRQRRVPRTPRFDGA